MEFKLHSKYKPTGDQPQAIKKLSDGFLEGNQFETLVGVTGSGKSAEEADEAVCSNTSDPGSRIKIELCAQVRLNIFNS